MGQRQKMKSVDKQYWAYYWAVGSLCGLIVLSLAWELWLAPLRGWFMVGVESLAVVFAFGRDFEG